MPTSKPFHVTLWPVEANAHGAQDGAVADTVGANASQHTRVGRQDEASEKIVAMSYVSRVGGSSQSITGLQSVTVMEVSSFLLISLSPCRLA